MLRDQFPFAPETTIEQHGIFSPEKVAVVRGRKSGDIVTAVRMTEEGFFDVDRVAEATSKQTGERLSRNRDGTKGVFLLERVANTYDNKGHKAHETIRKQEDIFFPKHFTETQRTDPNSTPTRTTTRTKGILFPQMFSNTDKKR